MSASNAPVAVTGASLVSSLGTDAAVACAAMRAGLVRASTLDTFIVGTRDDSTGVTVHAVPVLTVGFEGDARLLRLLEAALENIRQGGVTSNTGLRSAFYLSIPDPDREYTGLELIVDEDIRRREQARWEGVRNPHDERTRGESRARSLLTKALQLAQWNGTTELRAVSIAGNTGVSELIHVASMDIQRGLVDVAIVGGLDSFIDATSLLWLERRGRLKSPTNPAGLIPGEASGFLMLERPENATSRGATPLGLVHSPLLGVESRSRLSGQPSLGETLATLLDQIAKATHWSAFEPAWLIVDQNGESYGAYEWGGAVTRLADRHAGFTSPLLWYPAMSVGETGAATGIVQLNMAVQALRRGYAPSEQVALVACADNGRRSVTLVAKAR